MSQSDIAERIGVSKPTISALESGRTTWNVRHLVAVGAALDVDPFELVFGPRDPKSTAAQVAVLDALETGDPIVAMRALADWAETQPGQHLSPRQRAAVEAISRGDAGGLMAIAADMLRESGS